MSSGEGTVPNNYMCHPGTLIPLCLEENPNWSTYFFRSSHCHCQPRLCTTISQHRTVSFLSRRSLPGRHIQTLQHCDMASPSTKSHAAELRKHLIVSLGHIHGHTWPTGCRLQKAARPFLSCLPHGTEHTRPVVLANSLVT